MVAFKLNQQSHAKNPKASSPAIGLWANRQTKGCRHAWEAYRQGIPPVFTPPWALIWPVQCPLGPKMARALPPWGTCIIQENIQGPGQAYIQWIVSTGL